MTPERAAHGPDELSQGIRLLARLVRVAEQVCREIGISLPQYRLLVALLPGPERAGALAAEIGVTRPTLTSLVTGLAHTGCVRRVRLETDRRGIRLEVTPNGRAAVAETEQRLGARLRRLVDPETAAQARAIAARVSAALDHERSGMRGEAQALGA